MVIKSEGWRKQSSAFKICVAEDKEKGFFKTKEKNTAKKRSKGSKIGQTCGHSQIIIFVQKL